MTTLHQHHRHHGTQDRRFCCIDLSGTWFVRSCRTLVCLPQKPPQQPAASANAFCDDRKRSMKERKQSISLQTSSSRPMMTPQHPQSRSPITTCTAPTVTGVLFLVCRVCHSPRLLHKLRTLKNNKTTNGQRSSSGQTGFTHDTLSARPPAETLLRLSLPP